MSHLLLGVNIDHIATIRNARGTNYPNLVQAAIISEQAGADRITVHLREDRRHIKDNDVCAINDIIQIPLNLEIALTNEMINFACKVKPHFVCIVPEKRQELTTEGGLDVANQQNKINSAIKRLHEVGILVSLFIDPNRQQIESAMLSKASSIEIHTGRYVEALEGQQRNIELTRIIDSINFAVSLGLKVNAGHGLNYYNVKSIAALPEIHELHIGHAIVSRALFSGLSDAIKEMKNLMWTARH
ncbi:pyridoxine 5'-phosphate synthase [Candidatus Pantoea carbekii]|uniref:Pyridoxine 5'-phosphate synthase n=1 Tax=Candidatus Pantoea carbekii TaxID=1235990 RepID=U3U644_9GAMM|nr:pyridoxine 5'-phosphate synthase [Candidatus Pantoea carbekii]AKC31871.1 pyridoxal phosphate biosynthetic protein PdxJ [Candidatus Pantoea carbekii]BAO00385.1 PdxJ protein [Candidatus Pantoea carbekii]